jgi:hypothetical protein
LLGAVCALKPLLVVIIAAPLHISYYNSYALLLQNKGGMFKIFIIIAFVVSDPQKLIRAERVRRLKSEVP